MSFSAPIAAGTAGRPARPVRVIVFGQPNDSKRQWLDPQSEVWRGIEGIESVQFATGLRQLLAMALTQRRSLIIPVRERQIYRTPRLFRLLAPRRTVVHICHDKRLFARFAADNGFADLLPRHYGEHDPALPFPLVAKCPKLADGRGVAVVQSASDLQALRTRPPWAGRDLVLQDFVPGSLDRVTHCVAVKGRMVWHTTYEYLLDPEQMIQRYGSVVARRRVPIRPQDRHDIERCLAALDYDGPAAIDYRLRPDGRMVLFEINARLGGSLFRAENIDDLRGALQAIVNCSAP